MMMAELPPFYAQRLPISRRSYVPYVFIGAFVLGAGFAYLWGPTQPAAPALHVEAIHSTSSRPATQTLAERGREASETLGDVDPREIVGGEWPAHFPQPRKLAHPQPQPHHPQVAGDAATNPAELYSGEWPAHFPQPQKLAHPKPKAPKAVGDAATNPAELYSGEWPAHFPQPQKLAHPQPKAPKAPASDGVAPSEVYSSDWPAHFPEPHKLAHPHPREPGQTGDSSLAAVFLLGVALSAVVMAAVTGQKDRPKPEAYSLMADQDAFAMPRAVHPFQPLQPGHGLSLATKEQLLDPEVDMTDALHSAAHPKALGSAQRADV